MEVFLDFVFRRFPGALFGGLCYDRNHKALINWTHICFWITLIIFPFGLSMAYRENEGIVYIIFYSLFTFIIFFCIKFANFWLHKTFGQENLNNEPETDSKHTNGQDIITEFETKEELDSMMQNDLATPENQDESKIAENSNNETQKRQVILPKSPEERSDTDDEISSSAATSSTIPVLSTATRKSKTSTTAMPGERDSEVSSNVDKEISMQWPTSEQDDLSANSFKDISEDELSDGEIRSVPVVITNTTSNSTSKNNGNPTEDREASKTGLVVKSATNSIETNDQNGSSKIMDDIRNYADEQTVLALLMNDYTDQEEINKLLASNYPVRNQPEADISEFTPALYGYMRNDWERLEDVISPDIAVNQPKKSTIRAPEPRPPTQIVVGKLKITIPFERLTLLQLLDQNDDRFEIVAAIILATACSFLGFLLVPLYSGFSLFMIWFIVGCAQYSLIKSPQPDAPSPRHDFNKLNSYNRSIYFVLAALLILFLNYLADKNIETSIVLYDVSIQMHNIVIASRDLAISFLPWFPLIYVLALLPQSNTLFLCIIEQINIHCFGSTGSSTVAASIVDLIRSLIITAILFGVGYEASTQENYLFSLLLGLMVGLSFLHSRIVTDPSLCKHLFKKSSPGLSEINLTQDTFLNRNESAHEMSNYPKKRFYADLLVASFITVIITSLHLTSFFSHLHPNGFYSIAIICVFVGFLGRYLLETLRKPYPWNIFKSPFLQTLEQNAYEPPNSPSKASWFEKFQVVLGAIESTILFPLVFLTELTNDAPVIREKFGTVASLIIISVIGIKMFRGTLSDPSRHWKILGFTLIFFSYDLQFNEPFIINYFLASIFIPKFEEFVLKVHFLWVYTAPWGFSWGSAAHIFLQPLGVPHTTASLFQNLWSCVVSAPLYPLVGSALFFSSYGRPVKFWERDYKTNRVDSSQIKLADALDSTSEAEFNLNNLNSIFYEHLMASLQATIHKEIQAGRLGTVSSGDFYIIVNDTLTAMLHIVEVGNGYCTFQIRGMEFKGTYCQERELEEINRVDYTNDSNNCLCPNQILPQLLSFEDMLKFRWNAWQVANTCLMLQTYSISLTKASTQISAYSLRQVLIKSYVKAAIYYLIKSTALEMWLSDSVISAHINSIDVDYVDMDPIFSKQIDEDFDEDKDGVSVGSFDRIYGTWIKYCLKQRLKGATDDSSLLEKDCDSNTPLFKLCYALSLLARRCLIISPSHVTSPYLFLKRFYALFKGDFRISSTKDEFVLADVDIMHNVLGRAIRISLKLHQDHFIGENYEDLDMLYSSLLEYENDVVCCHETDPLWRQSILSNAPNLLSLRKQTENEDDLMILSLTLRYMKFRVIKLNREGVRGLWAGQVQELVFFGNTNAERGSIQQLKTIVRNLVNQSCDFPVGYPIFVSPLTTSYSSFWNEIVKTRFLEYFNAS